MNIDQLIELFRWMTIISIGILLLSSVLLMSLKNVFHELHSKLFGISKQQVAIISYGYLGLLKALVTIFIIVPYISLLIIR